MDEKNLKRKMTELITAVHGYGPLPFLLTAVPSLKGTPLSVVWAWRGVQIFLWQAAPSSPELVLSIQWSPCFLSAAKSRTGPFNIFTNLNSQNTGTQGPVAKLSLFPLGNFFLPWIFPFCFYSNGGPTCCFSCPRYGGITCWISFVTQFPPSDLGGQWEDGVKTGRQLMVRWFLRT